MIKSLDKVLQDPKLKIHALKALVENSFDSILITDATNRTKILYACAIAWAIIGAVIVALLNLSPWILGIPLISLLFPTFIFTVSDIFY